MLPARSLALAGALTAAVVPAAHAGGFAAVVTEPPIVVVEPEPQRSSFGVILPLVLLGALLAVAIANEDDDDEEVATISDARLKTDIIRTGTSPSGLPVYEFQYIGGDTTYQGVMAQDLLTLRPEAVTRSWLGFYTVDYARTDVDFHAVD
jgi:hypothetical protein